MTRSPHRGLQPTSRGQAPGDGDGHNDDDHGGGGEDLPQRQIPDDDDGYDDDNHDENGEDDSQGGAGGKSKLGISDSGFVLPSTRTQWATQMDNLVRRIWYS